MPRSPLILRYPLAPARARSTKIAIAIVLIACLPRGHRRCVDRRGSLAKLPIIALGISKEKPIRSEARCALGTVALRERDGTQCVPPLAKAVAVLLMRR